MVKNSTNLKTHLNNIFKHAIKLEIIDTNPMINIEMPKIKRINEVSKKVKDNFWDRNTLLSLCED